MGGRKAERQGSHVKIVVSDAKAILRRRGGFSRDINTYRPSVWACQYYYDLLLLNMRCDFDFGNRGD